MSPDTLTLYRLARGHNQVPDAAPDELNWRTVDAAVAGIEAWWTSELNAGRVHQWGPQFGPRDRKIEYSLVGWSISHSVKEKPDDWDEKNVIAHVIVSSSWRWREYKETQKRLGAVVEGVALTGWGPVERVYLTEWSTEPLARESYLSPVSMETKHHCPIAVRVIEFGEGVTFGEPRVVGGGE